MLHTPHSRLEVAVHYLPALHVLQIVLIDWLNEWIADPKPSQITATAYWIPVVCDQ